MICTGVPMFVYVGEMAGLAADMERLAVRTRLYGAGVTHR